MNRSFTQPSMSSAPPPFIPPVPRRLTARYQNIFASASTTHSKILLPLLFVFCFWFCESILTRGIGLPALFTLLAFYLLLFWYFKDNNRKRPIPTILLCIPTLLMATGHSLFYSPSTHFFTVTASLAVVATQILLLSGASRSKLFSFSMLKDAAVRLAWIPISNLDMPFRGIFTSNDSKRGRNTLYVLLGLAVALPLALILLSIFLSADEAYAQAVRTFFYNILRISVPRIVGDLVLTAALTLLLLSVFVTTKAAIPCKQTESNIKAKIPAPIVITVLSVLLFVTLSFVAVQFQYLFWSNRLYLPKGLSYAEYARRGFFEMAFASALIFLLILLGLLLTASKNEITSKTARILLAGMGVCDGIIIASAVKRMLLYINTNGLTSKRILTLWFMAIISVCLVILLGKCLRPRMAVMPAMLMTVVVACTALSFVNLDAWIASYNVEGYLSGALTEYSVTQLGELSYSATPATARLVGSAKDTDETHEEILAQLVRQRVKLKTRSSFHTFTFDRPSAEKALEPYADVLNAMEKNYDPFSDRFSSSDYYDDYAYDESDYESDEKDWFSGDQEGVGSKDVGVSTDWDFSAAS